MLSAWIRMEITKEILILLLLQNSFHRGPEDGKPAHTPYTWRHITKLFLFRWKIRHEKYFNFLNKMKIARNSHISSEWWVERRVMAILQYKTPHSLLERSLQSTSIFFILNWNSIDELEFDKFLLSCRRLIWYVYNIHELLLVK